MSTLAVVGVLIIGMSVCLLSRWRYVNIIAVKRAEGEAAGRFPRLATATVSLCLAVTLIGLSDIAFLVGYYGFLKFIDVTHRMSHWTPYNDPAYMCCGIICGGGLALWLASTLRFVLYPHRNSRRLHQWSWLGPMAFTMLIGGWWARKEMSERYTFCTIMAEYHADRVVTADDPKKAALHGWLKEWYERASVRPWVPVHPEHVPAHLEGSTELKRTRGADL